MGSPKGGASSGDDDGDDLAHLLGMNLKFAWEGGGEGRGGSYKDGYG